MDKKISEKVINRLTLYHCILQDFIDKGNEYISSKQIATLLRIDDSQVRKDINAAIRFSSTYEEFLLLMRAKGYEIKGEIFREDAPKYISSGIYSKRVKKVY